MTGDNGGPTENDHIDAGGNEWAPVRAADTITERAAAMGEIAQRQSVESNRPYVDSVEHLVNNYLLKATTDDALSYLRDLNEAYSEAFYNGDANDRIVEEYDRVEEAEFWYDHVMAAFSAGLQWVILHETLDNGEMREVVPDDWDSLTEHGPSHHMCECGNRLEWPLPEGCDHWKRDNDGGMDLIWVCECGYEIPNATGAEKQRHALGVRAEQYDAILTAIGKYSFYGPDATDYYRERSFLMGIMSVLMVAGEEGFDPRTDDPEAIGETVAYSLAMRCNDVDTVPAEM